VNRVAGKAEAEISDGLRSKTQKVQPVRCRHPDGHRDIVLVDTPGFDDTHLSDSQILRIIAEWMKKTYQNKIKLSGLLYLHRISDVRMAGTSRRNLAVFKDLCGAENMKNVVLVTTMWDEEDISDGERKEKQLISDFWQDMISLGSRTCRFHSTSESAWEIINHLDLKPRRPTLKIQAEMVDHHLPFQDTTAAATLLQSLVADFKKVWVRLLVGARRTTSPRKTLDSRSSRPHRRASTHRSTASASCLSAVSGSTDTSSVFSSDSGYPSLDWGGCRPNGRRNTLQTMVSGLRQVIPMVDLISNAVLQKSIKTVLHVTQHIERMGGGGTHHAIGHVLESSGWLLQGIVQDAAQSKLPKDMKKPLVSFQRSLIGLQNLVMNITKRNPVAPFVLQDEDIRVITACITSIDEIYNKPNFKDKLSISTITCLDNQLNVLRDNSSLNICECGISVVPEEE